MSSLSPESPARPVSPLSPEDVRRSLRISRREVGASATMLGLTDPFMIPYALALGASAFQAGLLSSARNLVLSLVQLKSADAVRWVRSRKVLVLWTVAIQIALWIPLAVVHPLFGRWAVAALIVLYTLGTSSSAFGGPAWGSLMSGYLAPDERGRYFGRLARNVGLWSTVATLVAGGVLHLVRGHALLGFGLLCAGAAVARAVSFRWLHQLAEGPLEQAPESHFSFWKFIRRTRTSNFVHFTLCVAGMSFATNLATPYFTVWVLEELRYSYFTYALTQLAATFTGSLVVSAWGKASDRVGNQAILRWTMVGAAVLPFLWPLSHRPAWLIALGLVGGIVWGGLNLCAVNFVYDAATPAKRARCLAYFNVINGCGVSAGALAGGWALEWLPRLAGSVFVTLFVVSAVLRLVSAAAFRRFVREVRPVRQAGLREVMYDLARTTLVNVLGLLSIRREEEREEREEGEREEEGDDEPRG